MEIEIKYFDGKYPSFNVMLSSNKGAAPFLEIKGCRIVDGQKGSFVGWPATKNEKTGKYWNHVYGNEAFSAAVLNKAIASMPSKQKQVVSDDDGDIPF
jgi:DNA-binding cell septation regulator SpoVG